MTQYTYRRDPAYGKFKKVLTHLIGCASYSMINGNFS